jgi:putative ABC transport system permease protein
VPFSLHFNMGDVWIAGHERPNGRGEVIHATRVSPDYFKTIGIRIVEGRSFTDADGPDTPPVAVINETMARRYWPGETALGKTFHARAPDGPLYRIVGIAADHKTLTVTEPPTPFIHVARAQQPTSYNVVLARAQGTAASLPQSMRRELLALEPDLVFVENQTMKDELAVRLFPARAAAWFVGGIGLVAMTLAAIGLYGVITYAVSRRTREIGIRMALGAHPASVLALIMRQGLVLTLAGLVAGCTLSVAVSRWLAGVLPGVSAADPIAWGCAVAVLIGVSTCANLIPARRAARIEPSVALHLE